VTAPVFQAPPTQLCTEQVRLRSDAVLSCALDSHEDDVHYDADEDLYWSYYPVEPAQ
jgi:hypothetical protein